MLCVEKNVLVPKTVTLKILGTVFALSLSSQKQPEFPTFSERSVVMSRNFLSRRKFLYKGTCFFGGGALVASLTPQTKAAALGFLEGTYIVQCLDGHRDLVSDITRNHTCEKPGCGKKSVTDGTAYLVCPDGHVSGPVGGITRQHKCGTCGKQCRR